MMTALPGHALLVVLVLWLLPRTTRGSIDNDLWITYDRLDGETLYLRDNRRPALYTGDFGDCLGESLLEITRFDAAYYRDNMTVLFHLEGNTALQNETLVMYIGVYAYGETRFELTFQPCRANIASLCPLNSSVPVSANGVIPVAEGDVSGIPKIALSIPDFEGQAIIRIFANSTQSEIGCYSAVITNGHTFAHPSSVGSALRIFILVAMIASFATAIYGENIPTLRLHYAHSHSVWASFAVFQHIFFTGALSVNWPSVLVAWWRNFAWSAGMIPSTSMQNAINRLIGNDAGNTSQVGAVGPSPSDQIGGGYDISQIYKRMLRPSMLTADNHPLTIDMASTIYTDVYAEEINEQRIYLPDASRDLVGRALEARDYIANRNDGYRWYGRPVGAGMPLPGNYAAFAGTLAQENILISNAFMTGLMWFLILLALLVVCTAALKWVLESLAVCRVIGKKHLRFFRHHWLGFTALVALRTFYLAFFSIVLLAVFELSQQSSTGVKLIATVVLLIFIVGITGAAACACYFKSRLLARDLPSPVERKKLFKLLPCWRLRRTGTDRGNRRPSAHSLHDKLVKERIGHPMVLGVTWAKRLTVTNNVHDNAEYITNFGWLVGRFRSTRWWFFIVWLLNDLLRACCYGGTGRAMIQIFGLLVIEVPTFAYAIWARPFEGCRLNALVVYCLGFSKVASVALSAAFDAQFRLDRITTTIIGIVIIAIQGILTCITLVAIVLGAISSYMSLSRNCERFRPQKWHGLRERYLDHLDRVANDDPRERKPTKRQKRRAIGQEEHESGFELRAMRRMAKIEDEDEEFVSEMHTALLRAATPVYPIETTISTRRSGSATPTPIPTKSRAGSIQSLSRTNLPRGARVYKPIWSARDFIDSRSVNHEDGPRRSVSVDGAVDDEDTTLTVDGAGFGRAPSSLHVWSPLPNSDANAGWQYTEGHTDGQIAKDYDRNIRI